MDVGVADDQAKQRFGLLENGCDLGGETPLPTITPFIADPSAAVRSAAVLALRFIDSSQADDLLIKALTSEPEDTVRLEAATAMKFREMNADTFEAQKRVFLTDNAVSVRLAVLNNLWQAHEKFPEAYKLVKRAAVKDGSKDVRKVSTNIIAKYPKSH
jgi:HEAT repeat protein